MAATAPHRLARRPGPGRARSLTGAAVLSLVAVLLAPIAPPAGAAGPGEARPSIEGGIGWPACSVLTLRPNPSGRPAQVPDGPNGEMVPYTEQMFIDELQDSIGAFNASFLRTNTAGALLNLGPVTTSRARGGDPGSGDLEDGVFTVAWESSQHSGAGGRAYLSWTVSGVPPRPDRINGADIALNAQVLGTFDADVRRSIITHEIGHTLGLDHVGSAHEALSLGYLFAEGDVGPGTSQVVTHMYNAPCNSKPTFGDLPFDWELPTNRVVIGAGVQKVASTAQTPIELGTFTTFAMSQPPGNGGRGTGWAQQAVICRDDVFADCLTGAALAGGGPVLFVPGGPDGRISGQGAPGDAQLVKSVLADALPTNRQLYVLGGPNAVSNEILNDLKGTWPSVRRIAGPPGSSRFETAVEIAKETRARYGDTGVVLLTRHDNPADAVTAGVAAGAKGHPIVLTTGDASDPAKRGGHPATTAWLQGDNPQRVLLIGGPNAVPPSVEAETAQWNPQRVAGRTRTETSTAVARHPDLWNITSFGTTVKLIAANGHHPQTWNVVLASTPYAAFHQAPVLLTNQDFVPISKPEGGSPGEPGWWLSHVPPVNDEQVTSLTVFKIGGDLWTDDHAVFGVRAYTLLHKEG